MRRNQQSGAFTGKGAAILLAAALFAVSLLGFTILKYDPQTGSTYSPQTDVQAAAPGDWAANLYAIELPGIKIDTNKVRASLSDPDWPMPTPTQAESSGSEVTPIVTTKTGPVIMLYSTHSDECYKKVDGEVYAELPNSNTVNKNFNILKVNSTLSGLMANTYKLPIYFNNTDHELGKYYTTSYERSLQTIEKAKKSYSTLAVFFDIHRDSAGSGGTDDSITIDGKKCAKIMFVVGTGQGLTGTGFSEKPNWQKNKALADLLTAEINKIAPGLCRPVRVKTGRYNQHVSDAALAIEIGHNKNTLQEALNTVPYLAEALFNVLTQKLDIKTVAVQ